MPGKVFENIEVRDVANDVSSVIPVITVEGANPGATLAVIGGVHGTEYAAHDAVVEFARRLDPAVMSGTVRIVLTADTLALTLKSAYLNPLDGKNLNRVWPGDPAGTITDVIAHTITTRVIDGAAAVIDVHGGEWDEDISAFVITHATGDADLDRRTVELAVATGFPYIEVTPADGPVLGAGTGSGEAMRAGTPAMTLEAGGAGARDHYFVHAHVQGLENIARHLGILPGDLTTWAGEPVVIDHGILMKTTEGGIVRPAVRVGDWIQEGEVFSEILDQQGNLVEQLLAPEAGAVVDVITARGIKAGGFAGKIVVCPPRKSDAAHDG